MPKRLRKDSDFSTNAFRVVEEATHADEARPPTAADEPIKNPAAQALGRLGGLKGGRARAEALTPEQRRESAKKAAAARWATEN